MTNFASFLMTLLGTILTGISPELRELLESMLDKLEAKAKATPNKFDDLLVSLLKAIFKA